MAKRERTTRVPVAMPEESRPAAWLRNFRLSGFALSLLLLIVAALVVLAPSLRTLVAQRQQIAALQSQVDDAKTAVTNLTGEVDRWKDPAYVESQARNRLYYVFPGDVSYLVTGEASGTPKPGGQPISARIQTTQVDWMRTLLSSVYTAGLTQSPPAQLPGSGG
ncbi:MAG: septum formation initiator family protein [Acidobacteria bacterium]|nr:septum formation initiator family protein [Acidobacteriota bacterium]